MNKTNKAVVKLVHQTLKQKGVAVKVGHVYEALSKLCGWNSWNVAKAKDVDFSKLDLQKCLDSVCRYASAT